MTAPASPCYHPLIMPEGINHVSVRESRRTVVLSDTHFGEEGAMLAHPVPLECFLEELGEGGPVDEVVLLGDTWDLWRTGLPDALDSSRLFLRRLCELPGLRSLVVVFGNHDHHLFFNPAENRALREAKPGGGLRSTRPPLLYRDEGELMRSLTGIPPHIDLTAVYPFHMLESGGRRVMLTHGHQLDFFARRLWWAKTAWLARLARRRVRGVGPGDLELLNAPFFEALYLFGRVPDLGDRAFRWYRIFRGAARLLGITASGNASIRRFTPVDENALEVSAALTQLYPGFLPDAFVFGHTHRAGYGRTRLGLLSLEMYNAGCWVREDGATPGTWLEIRDGEVSLHRLGQPPATPHKGRAGQCPGP